ncbi:hypothetical protein ACJMK2_012294 [Sinanodonta woodiana]|uniref:RecA family profile 1 domain-containing protein n=1 Tax=Sinanodonta woodiana TaxID=1069815 RepID=A0ABD3VAU3_SINWO
MALLKAGLCTALNNTVLENLRSVGIKTTLDFITKDLEAVAQQASVPYKDLLAIRRVILAQYSGFPLNGAELYDNGVLTMAILSTGCTSIDELLDGGLYTAEVTEVAGSIAAGKTQMCFTSAASVICKTKQNVIFVDTCGSFSAERISIILEENGESEPEQFLSQVRCFTAFDVYELIGALETIRHNKQRQMDPFFESLKLLIVDNVASVIYPILGGPQSDGQSLITIIGQKLKILAVEFSLAVLITNNLVSSEWGGTLSASLGRVWSHVPHTRLVILPHGNKHTAETPERETRREMMIVKSSRGPTNKCCNFIIASSRLSSVR